MPNLPEIQEENQKMEGILPTEQEIERLRQELAAKEGQLQRLREMKKEKVETIFPQEKKEEIRKKIEEEKEEIGLLKEKPGTAPPPKPKAKISPVIKDEHLVRDLQYVMSLPKPRQVKVLVYFAFKKGLHYAIHIAEHLKNPYILDEFHDTLVDELYELLKKKKKI